MAILFGTTADGETLPVEVNEFGQLIAEGLNGPPGPPGPPGVGELPPNPFEGAILGWKDNTLSWLGAPVPLPAGTYGPILSYENGLLTLEEDVSLSYLASIFLSDDQGNQLTYVPLSSPITQVISTVVSSARGFKSPQPAVATNLNQILNSWEEIVGTTQFSQDYFFAVVPEVTATGQIFSENGSAFFSINVNSAKGEGDYLPDGTRIGGSGAYSNGEWTLFNYSETSMENYEVPVANAGYTLFRMTGPGTNGTLLSSTEFTLVLENADGLDEFAVGDEVQPGVNIISIDYVVPSITTSGGSWDSGESVVGPPKSGAGTVQTTLGNTIVLRENNGEWKVGSYITAPQQSIAYRYTVADDIRKKMN